MLKRQSKLITRLSKITDQLVVVFAFILAYAYWNTQVSLLDFRYYGWILLLILPVWHLLIGHYQLHASIRRLSTLDIAAKVFNVTAVGGFSLSAALYFIDRDTFSRGLLLSFLLFSFSLLVAEKLLLRHALGLFRRKGYNTRNLLIVGTEEKARRFCELIQDHRDWGLQIIGFVQVIDAPLKSEVCGYPVLDSVDRLLNVCKRHPVDEVVFCLPKDSIVSADDFLADFEELGITVRMVLDFFELRRSGRELGFFHDEIPILTFHTKSLDSTQLFLKRILDVVGALVGLTITALALPFIAWAIKRDDPGPIFFGQVRVGESGRTFTCWKFRSMYVDAEVRKQELMDKNEMKGAIFKIKDDPRIIPVGHFLRRSSLDELPQFWNVLKGEMSLVGTRPPTPAEVEQYENWHRRRISIKPGITGLWQVSGRNAIDDFDEIVRLDLQYIDQWNVWLDVKLLFKTLQVVFLRQGSC
jgi:exopolysaccharide biosynthesis polyprenyl glycosylphosphotransferase